MRALNWYKITALGRDRIYWIAAERSGFAVYGQRNPDGSFYWMVRVASKTSEGNEPSVDRARAAAEQAFREAENAIGWANI